MGGRRGGSGHLLLPRWNLKKNCVICCRPTKYSKIIARAFGARHRQLIFQSKTSQKRKKLVCAPKNGRCFVRRAENVSGF